MNEDEIREVFMAGYRRGASDWACCYGCPDDNDVIGAYEEWQRERTDEPA